MHSILTKVLLALCLVMALPSLTACSSGAKDASSYVEQGAAFAYTGAVTALEVLDAREVAHIDTLNASMPTEIAAAEARVQRLERARDALAIVRAWLTKERTEDDARAAMKDAIAALLLAAQEAESQGVKLPRAVGDGLSVAAAWVGAI